MNVDEYRKAYTAQIESERQAASGAAGGAAGGGADDPANTSDHIATFSDAAQPRAARLAALRRIQVATFGGSSFDRFRSSFKDALRDVASRDKDPELRATSLEVLATEKDEAAKQMLLKGLDNPAEAIVPTAKALQLLAHDDHGAAIPAARKIWDGQHDVSTKAEALRVLASDPNSSQLFADILADRTQPPQLRSVSANGLRLVNPKRFEEIAKDIVVDEGEHETVRERALGALNHLLGASTKASRDFTDALGKLDLGQKSAGFRSAVTNFLQSRTQK